MQWKPHGPVRLLRTEVAEWDLNNGQWQAPRHTTLTQFRTDGNISESENHNPNGSVLNSRYIYDEAGRLREVQSQLDDGPLGKVIHYYDDLGRRARITTLQSDGAELESEIWKYDDNGRKTKVQAVPKVESSAFLMTFGIEGSEQGYGAENVVEIMTRYDDRELPSEALFYDTNHSVVLRVACVRDAAGRLISEESQCGDKPHFSVEQHLANASAEERAAMSAVFAQLFAPQHEMARTTYRYDDHGRQIERYQSMSSMSERRTTWHYNEHDNPTLEVEEHVSRELQLDESGNLQPTQEKSSRHEVRFDYKYDVKGNWTERVVSVRYEENPEFQPSNIERREITYEPGA